MKQPLIIRRVTGHSMQPSFEEGQIVFATSLLGYNRGDVVIAKIHGREIIKRITEVDDGFASLGGDNPADSIDSRQFGQIEQSRIVGRVFARV